MMEHRLVEFAARIPSSLKLKGTTLKYLLRQLSRRYLDEELVTRKKQGFGFPLAFWMRDEMSGFLRHIAKSSGFVEAGLFEPRFISDLTEEHISGRRDHNYRIWVLLNLEIWHRLFLEGDSVDQVTEWIERHAA